MSDPKSPGEKAKDTLQKGVSEMFRAAKSAGKGIKRELDKGSLGKTIEDGGKEILRAATNVATFVGSELQTLSQKAQETFDPSHGSPNVNQGAANPGAPNQGPPVVARPVAETRTPLQWPASREEFESRFGKVAGDWPRSAEEFERRFGYAPRDKPVGPTPKDPGFRIATPGDPK